MGGRSSRPRCGSATSRRMGSRPRRVAPYRGGSGSSPLRAISSRMPSNLNRVRRTPLTRSGEFSWRRKRGGSLWPAPSSTWTSTRSTTSRTPTPRVRPSVFSAPASTQARGRAKTSRYDADRPGRGGSVDAEDIAQCVDREPDGAARASSPAAAGAQGGGGAEKSRKIARATSKQPCVMAIVRHRPRDEHTPEAGARVLRGDRRRGNRAGLRTHDFPRPRRRLRLPRLDAPEHAKVALRKWRWWVPAIALLAIASASRCRAPRARSSTV